MKIAPAAPMPSQSVRVTGFVPPIATPFRDGKLDLDSLKRLLDDLVGSVSGILVGGSVGETPSLTLEERMMLMRETAAFLQGSDLLLAVSIADNALDNSRRLSEVAGEVGADLLMVLCPNYFSNDRRMLEAYFAAVSDFASADLCLYDNPVASHTPLSIEDIRAMAAVASKLTHVKVTDTALGKVEALRAQTSLVVLAGDDVVLLHQLLEGAEGAMVALPMIYPQRAATLWQARQRADEQALLQAYRPVSHFIHAALGAPDYPAVIKTILHQRGVIASPEVRLPLMPLTDRRRQQVIAAL